MNGQLVLTSAHIVQENLRDVERVFYLKQELWSPDQCYVHESREKGMSVLVQNWISLARNVNNL